MGDDLAIEVSPDLEQRLHDLAAERGVSVDDFVREVLEARAAPIVRDPARCAGDPVLAGTRTAVHDVVSYARRFDWDLERVQRDALPHISLDQVHAAIAWYREHTEEIDAILVRSRDDYLRGLAEAPARP